MPTVSVHDPKKVLTLGSSFNLAFSQALGLLATATAPSPRSRYRPASRWAIAKYSTVCDPRRRRGSFIVNPGIRDLDPHQKGVLSDDMGVAFSLGALDQQYGVFGLADVYAWEQAGLLTLKSPGRHRRMPDYVVLLGMPVAGSYLALLECKGSVVPGNHGGQLKTACENQLDNVDTVLGSRATTIPKIAAATQLLLGGRASLHLSDPPAELRVEPDKLRANLLALEYSLFGDYRSANEVWKAYGLPTYTNIPQAQLAGSTPASFTDEAVTTLAATRKFREKATGTFEEIASIAVGHAVTRVQMDMSPSAVLARENNKWDLAINGRTHKLVESTTSETIDEDKGTRRRIVESAKTAVGLFINSTIDVQYVVP